MLTIFLLYLVAFATARDFLEIKSTAEIVSKPYSLLYFHTHDCQYCNAFDPDFEYIASLYNGNDNLQIAKINGREQTNLSKMFGVTSFPTVKLYDATTKKVISFTGERLIGALQDFLEENSDALPNKDKIRMNIDVVQTAEEIDNATGPVLVVFASKISDDWKKYYYPNHFYQRLARDFPDVKFKIVFFEEDRADLMQKYHVSNIPSLVYVDGDYIKVHNTFSTNQLVNYMIPEDKLREFVENVHIEEKGMSFLSLDELQTHVVGLEYEGHKQWRGGMNVVQNKNNEKLTLEEEYAKLVDKIGL